MMAFDPVLLTLQYAADWSWPIGPQPGESRALVAWHPGRPAILRFKNVEGLQAWQRRRWDAFPEAPTISDVTESMIPLAEEFVRRRFTPAKISGTPLWLNVSPDFEPVVACVPDAGAVPLRPIEGDVAAMLLAVGHGAPVRPPWHEAFWPVPGARR